MRSGSAALRLMKIALDGAAQQRAGRLEHPVEGGEAFQRHTRATEQRMAAAHDQAGLLDADDLALEQPRIEVVGNAGDDEVVARGEQLAGQHVAGLDLDVDLEPGVPFADAPDRRHRELDGRRGDRAQKDRAALAALEIGDLAIGLAHFQEHRAGAARQRLAGRRQRDAARQALAQLDAEDVLHFGDHARGRGLRNIEDMGGGADLGMLSERDDHAHVTELQPAAQQALRCQISGSIRRSIRFIPAPIVRDSCHGRR